MPQATLEFKPARMGRIHAARLENSPRLQRLLAYLQDGCRHTTLDIVTNARICAVNSAVCELRCNGIEIACEPIARGIYTYWMPPDALDTARRRLEKLLEKEK